MDSDVVNPVESEVFDFIASCRVLLTVTFVEKISVPVEVAASPVVMLQKRKKYSKIWKQKLTKCTKYVNFKPII